jgi:hypothetical protein
MKTCFHPGRMSPTLKKTSSVGFGGVVGFVGVVVIG